MWPDGFLIGVYGAKGSGKSTVTGILHPDVWLTSEQTCSQASASLAWAQGASWQPIEVVEVATPGDVSANLADIYRGTVVLDSISRVGTLTTQKDALEAVHQWARHETDRRAAVIWQVNERGEPAGLTELQHLVDQICGVAIEESGLRRLHATKNRAGSLGVAYFGLTAKGLERPSFRYSYSVEGPHGAYQLVPWPSSGARWAGLLDELFERLKEARPGLASAGRHVYGYPDGVLLPADVDQRRAFAEAHGLTWYDGRDGDAVSDDR